LRLQAYDFEVIHTKGSDNPSDYLSRHTNLISSDKQDKMAERYVNFVTSFAFSKAMTLEEIQQATVEDVTLQYLVYLMQNNSWNNLENPPEKFKEADCAQLRIFHGVKDDLTVTN